MIDSEFERKGREMATTWDNLLETNDALMRRIAELERDNANQAKLLDALRGTIEQMEYEADTQHAAALDLQAQRDAAIADAQALAGFADYARRVPSGVFYTRDENELITKYLKP